MQRFSFTGNKSVAISDWNPLVSFFSSLNFLFWFLSRQIFVFESFWQVVGCDFSVLERRREKKTKPAFLTENLCVFLQKVLYTYYSSRKRWQRKIEKHRIFHCFFFFSLIYKFKKKNNNNTNKQLPEFIQFNWQD